MSQITTNPSILAAAKQAIEVLLQFKGVAVAFVPQKGLTVVKPGGGEDFVAGIARTPQMLSLTQIGADLVTDASTDEQRYVTRNYVGTGRWNMLVEVGDEWEDLAARYKVETVDQTSGFKTSIEVVGFVK